MMIDDGALDELRGRLGGRVFLPTDAGYDDAREIFNVMHDKRPAVVARCASTDDVVACVDVARRNGVLVAVRSGGHSVAGNSTCEGGMVIDLAGLTRVEVDPQARTARAGGGVLWGGFRRRDTGARAPHAWRAGDDDRGRRLYHRWGIRVDVVQIWSDVRQPHFGRGCAGQRQCGTRECGGEH